MSNVTTRSPASQAALKNRANKQELIIALAAELQKERVKAAELADEVAISEGQVNGAHNHLMRTQAKLVARKEKKDQTIALLRKELKRARSNLEAAVYCDEVEAAHLLPLLEDRAPPSDASTQDTSSEFVHPYAYRRPDEPASSPEVGRATTLAEDLSSPNLSQRPRQGAMHQSSYISDQRPYQPNSITGTARERVAERMRVIQARLAEKEKRGAFKVSIEAVKEKHMAQIDTGHEIDSKGLKSEFRDSIDEERRASFGSSLWKAGQRCQKGKGKTWSNLFPGANGKRK